MRGQRINPRAARVAQSQQFGDLVKGFSGCIVERGAHVAICEALSFMPGQIKMSVAAGNHQGQGSAIAIVEHFLLRHQNGVNMTLEVVNGDQRLAQGKGQRFGISDAHQERARQARALGHRDGVKVREADTGFLQCGADHGNNVAQMFARGEFRNHTAIGRMDRYL
jgi:hypothetical protein